MITEEQIERAASDAYMEAGENAYFTNGFRMGVYFVLDKITETWEYVSNQTPPENIELLAKEPDGTIHLTSWRPAHDIFSCQRKEEYAGDWQWKSIT